MKVKELIKALEKYDGESDVVIRFALDEDDEVGFVLVPDEVGKYISSVAIYGSYTDTEEDCDFIGQIDIKTLYKQEKERRKMSAESKSIIKEDIKDLRNTINNDIYSIGGVENFNDYDVAHEVITNWIDRILDIIEYMEDNNE